MTTTHHTSTASQPTLSTADGARVLDAASARTLVADAALVDRAPGPVGIEVEGHVHPLGRPDVHPDFGVIAALVDELADLPHGGRTTVEPGGQVEVSSGVHRDAATAIAATRAEVALVRARLREEGLAWVFLGADPVRPSRRLNPAPRYACMEGWFDAQATGAADGRTMMCSTAALQVNVEAGRPHEWASRVRRASRLGPLLTALTGTSAHLAGVDTGVASARQRAWSGMPPLVSGPLADTDDPVATWTERALAAPVMHLPDDAGALRCADDTRSFAQWVDRPGGWPAPTVADLRRHLTTVFPPLRLRGFLELRCLDALPEPWWPAVVAAVVAWLDDERVHPVVDVAIAPVAAHWTQATTRGLADPDLAAAAVTCLDAALAVVDLPDPDLAALTELRRLAARGTSVGALIADDLRTRGAGPVLEELSR
ncbi:glutamate-cysteine ligase family protein [Solicola sp. PLA-1-18]|uniref:glutamate-cysteine ligase family protein n=1 Tax=Solicola sp. PLA-1-18 TaxID=3380532 RepID=UPI003B76D027